jgi:hypothetical protein
METAAFIKNNDNVTGLHTGSVWEDIEAFLSKYRKKNQSTASIYEKGPRMFLDGIETRRLKITYKMMY